MEQIFTNVLLKCLHYNHTSASCVVGWTSDFPPLAPKHSVSLEPGSCDSPIPFTGERFSSDPVRCFLGEQPSSDCLFGDLSVRGFGLANMLEMTSPVLEGLGTTPRPMIGVTGPRLGRLWPGVVGGAGGAGGGAGGGAAAAAAAGTGCALPGARLEALGVTLGVTLGASCVTPASMNES